MEQNKRIVHFKINGDSYALHLDAVERVVHAVYVTPIPRAPEIVTGIINIEGTVIPVIDVRKCFRLPLVKLHPDHRFIIANSAKRKVALMVDSVGEVMECEPGDIENEKTVLPEMPFVKGIVVLENGLILINDIDKFLSLEDEKILEDALNNRQ